MLLYTNSLETKQRIIASNNVSGLFLDACAVEKY